MVAEKVVNQMVVSTDERKRMIKMQGRVLSNQLIKRFIDKHENLDIPT